MKPRTVIAAVVAGGALLVPAGAAMSASGITPLSPKSGATVPVGTAPTYKLRVSGSGTVWIDVCTSKKKLKEGVICDTADFHQAKKGAGGVFTYKPKLYAALPDYYLNTPGTYYWQAYRIACGSDLNDCKQEGPITKFKVG
jgi:hypothetical protein